MATATLALIIVLSFTGCVTSIKVKKTSVHPDAEGIRYSLPQPFLLVCPGPEGTVSVTETYLPDPTKEYAIRGESFLSKYDLNVEVENGLLTSFEFNPDGTGVAQSVISNAGDIAKAKIDAELEARKKEAEKTETLRKERATAISKAQESVSEAQAELDIAIAEREMLEEQLQAAKTEKQREALSELLRKAERDVAKARAKLRAAELILNRLTAEDNQLRVTSLDADPKKGGAQAWGCVLFQVIEDEATGAVKLKAAKAPIDRIPGNPSQTTNADKPQRPYLTSFKIEPPKTTVELKLYVQGSGVVRSNEQNVKLLIVQTNKGVEINTEEKVHLKRIPGNGSPAKDADDCVLNVVLNSPTQFTVELKPETPEGDYSLSISVKVGKDTICKDIRFKVR